MLSYLLFTLDPFPFPISPHEFILSILVNFFLCRSRVTELEIKLQGKLQIPRRTDRVGNRPERIRRADIYGRRAEARMIREVKELRPEV